MSGYQVTGWLAWQHHKALVLMASLYPECKAQTTRRNSTVKCSGCQIISHCNTEKHIGKGKQILLDIIEKFNLV